MQLAAVADGNGILYITIRNQSCFGIDCLVQEYVILKYAYVK
jgi:hypothetical protein